MFIAFLKLFSMRLLSIRIDAVKIAPDNTQDNKTNIKENKTFKLHFLSCFQIKAFKIFLRFNKRI
jgi:hypothetical protein